MKGDKQKKFWGSFAEKYDNFINRFAKEVYERSFSLIREELNKKANVLEIATGTGLIALKIADKVKAVTAIDYAPEMIEIAKEKQAQSGIENINFCVGRAEEVESPDKSYDVVIASNVFHLLPGAEKALWEIHRLLTDNGKLIIPTYCHGQNLKARIISAIMGLTGFKAENRWSTKQFRLFVEKEGFKVLKEEIIPDKIPLSFIVASKQ